ncbi:hypothetical protein C9374_003356 [Naegleria lovaniensis]|uniref:Uncharacterized protein n=1 Tax=Naegleria lovaniensis TaxID=51637 RepID=A0AA88KLN2_NAELO|nr:uncharacterized protein C9374_003356 [Naegleria lovaniensis]KAG2385541.1 hypothetical protein C9374_003356 [Naegleria lovaniensis]
MVKFEDISNQPQTDSSSHLASSSSLKHPSTSRVHPQQGLKFRFSPFFLSLLLVGGFILHGYISFHPDLNSIKFLSSFFKLFAGYQYWLRIGFYGAVLVHIIESVVCYGQIHSFFKTHQVKRDESVLWKYTIQTLIVGFPSFWVLHEELSKFEKSH